MDAPGAGHRARPSREGGLEREPLGGKTPGLAGPQDGDVEALERRVAQLRVRRDRVLELFVDGNIDRAEKDRRLGAFSQEIAAAEAALAAAQPAPAAEITPEDVLAIVGAFAEWSFLARLERRRVLESLSPTFYIRRLPGKRGRFAVDGVRFPFAGLSGMCDSGGRL